MDLWFMEVVLLVGQRHSEDQDLYLDSAALNLHDFYAGLERIFSQIASTVDGNVPTGHEWHRDLLRQMSVALHQMRPPVLTDEPIKALEEYKNIWGFDMWLGIYIPSNLIIFLSPDRGVSRKSGARE